MRFTIAKGAPALSFTDCSSLTLPIRWALCRKRQQKQKEMAALTLKWTVEAVSLEREKNPLVENLQKSDGMFILLTEFLLCFS